MLAAAVAAGAGSLCASAAQVAELVPIPPHRAERPLTEALATYRALDEAGGWPVIAAGPSMRQGDSGERVVAVHRRLSRERYLAAETATESGFGPALELAVREFQRRHGLEEDGIVGRATLAALNVPAASRAAQIELNLARLSLLPGDLGGPYVAVNIAAQHLQLVEDATIPLVSRLIVGQPSTPTPVFSSSIDRIILNPPWNVPASIAVNEILPRLPHDPEYLLNHNMIIVDRPNDPHGLAIDWSSAAYSEFASRLKELPGPHNALGQIKFNFPNPYRVYLHDTPAKQLFERTRRTFSHGCMRMEHPVDLAALLLRDQGWERAAIESTIAAGRTLEIPLERPVAIWVLYLTAFMETDGTLHFREDVYGLDERGRIFEGLGAASAQSSSSASQPCRG